MSAAESTLQPTFLRQQPPYDPKELVGLFDLFTWFRGEMRVGTLGAGFNVGAGGTSTQYIEPPDDQEEWEVLYVLVRDANGIDAADTVSFGMQDGATAAVFVVLQSSAMGTVATLTGTHSVFPNRTANNVSIVTSMGDSGLITRKRDAKQPDKRFFIGYAASATVGTRGIFVNFVYRRRRLK